MYTLALAAVVRKALNVVARVVLDVIAVDVG